MKERTTKANKKEKRRWLHVVVRVIVRGEHGRGNVVSRTLSLVKGTVFLIERSRLRCKLIRVLHTLLFLRILQLKESEQQL